MYVHEHREVSKATPDTRTVTLSLIFFFNLSALQKTSTGQPFWSGPKRCPKVIEFNAEESLHLDFIEASAILFAETYGIKRKAI